MKFYTRILKTNELGIRGGAERMAGRFVLISKSAIESEFFPPLSQRIHNDEVFLRFLLPNGLITVAKLKYHNDTYIVEGGSRDEYRLYLNNQLEYEHFEPNGVLVFRSFEESDIADYRLTYVSPIEAIELRTRLNDNSHALFEENELLNSLFGSVDKESLSLTMDEDVKEDLLGQMSDAEEVEEEPESTKLKRNASFRTYVLFFYGNKCAITGSEFLMSYGSLNNLEVAHIKSHQSGGPGKVSNGMPLERNLHWAYDKGLFTITDNKIVVHPEVDSHNSYLQQFNGKHLTLPEDTRAHPREEYFRWHQETIFGLFTRSDSDSTLERYL